MIDATWLTTYKTFLYDLWLYVPSNVDKICKLANVIKIKQKKNCLNSLCIGAMLDHYPSRLWGVIIINLMKLTSCDQVWSYAVFLLSSNSVKLKKQQQQQQVTDINCDIYFFVRLYFDWRVILLPWAQYTGAPIDRIKHGHSFQVWKALLKCLKPTVF